MFATMVLLIFSAAAELQPAVRSVLVSGVVQDQTGAILPGAQVSLAPVGTDGTGTPARTIVTDSKGTFRFDQVPPGSFVIRVEFPGFKAKTTPIRVGARAPAAVTIVMEIEGLTQEISVASSGQASTSTSANLNAISVDQNTLDDLPILDQDVVGALSRFLDSSAIGTNGTSLVVDGLEVSGLTVSASTIQQIKINQDPYSAEFMRPGRGRIEIVTKPGGKDYSGTLNFRFRDSDFNARNAFATTKPEEQRRTFEGSFGGLIPNTKATS